MRVYPDGIRKAEGHNELQDGVQDDSDEGGAVEQCERCGKARKGDPKTSKWET